MFATVKRAVDGLAPITIVPVVKLFAPTAVLLVKYASENTPAPRLVIASATVARASSGRARLRAATGRAGAVIRPGPRVRAASRRRMMSGRFLCDPARPAYWIRWP